MKKKYDKVNLSWIIGKKSRNLPKTRGDKSGVRHRLEIHILIIKKSVYLLRFSFKM